MFEFRDPNGEGLPLDFVEAVQEYLLVAEVEVDGADAQAQYWAKGLLRTQGFAIQNEHGSAEAWTEWAHQADGHNPGAGEMPSFALKVECREMQLDGVRNAIWGLHEPFAECGIHSLLLTTRLASETRAP